MWSSRWGATITPIVTEVVGGAGLANCAAQNTDARAICPPNTDE